MYELFYDEIMYELFVEYLDLDCMMKCILFS